MYISDQTERCHRCYARPCVRLDNANLLVSVIVRMYVPFLVTMDMGIGRREREAEVSFPVRTTFAISIHLCPQGLNLLFISGDFIVRFSTIW